MELNNLPKTTTRSKKRVGRGIGSGRGKTSGRGTKGVGARDTMALGFIGGTLPLYKRLPYRRGWKNRKVSPDMVPVGLSDLGVFPANSEVTLQSLVTQGLVKSTEAKNQGVKIVARGTLTIALKVNLPVTKSAAALIEKAGGQVING